MSESEYWQCPICGDKIPHELRENPIVKAAHTRHCDEFQQYKAQAIFEALEGEQE